MPLGALVSIGLFKGTTGLSGMVGAYVAAVMQFLCLVIHFINPKILDIAESDLT